MYYIYKKAPQTNTEVTLTFQSPKEIIGLSKLIEDLRKGNPNPTMVLKSRSQSERAVLLGAKQTKAADLYAMGVILEELCKHAAIHGGPGQAELRSMTFISNLRMRVNRCFRLQSSASFDHKASPPLILQA
jgi:hypothetical protein